MSIEFLTTGYPCSSDFEWLEDSSKEMACNKRKSRILFFFFFLSLAPQPNLGLGLLLKIRLDFLEASQQFSFLHGRVIPTPNHHPGGPGICYLYLSEAK
jgi:hypothetical protein